MKGFILFRKSFEEFVCIKYFPKYSSFFYILVNLMDVNSLSEII
jgi:hypothetical protein